MKTKRFCLLAATGLILTVMLAGETAHSFDYFGFAWCCETDIVYCINPEEPDTICGANPRSIIDVVNAAAASWNAQGTAFQLVYGGTTNDRSCILNPATGFCMSNRDGKNVVSMATCPMPPGVLASGFLWFVTDCCIIEADICFSQDFSWFKDQDSTACPGMCLDMQSLATSQFGYWAALGQENHTGVIGYRPVTFGVFAFCEIRRTITADDSAGLAYIYDDTGVIVSTLRCDRIHSHPPYAGSPKTPLFMNCSFVDCCCFGPRGDLNGDGDDANILDLTFLVDFIFRGSNNPGGCPDESDVNKDGSPANILDLTYLVDWIFRGGFPPIWC